MPTYQYACTECGHSFEQFQSFSEDSLTECPECAGRLRKLFNAVGVVFKGSGFYRTDSRAAGGASEPAAAGASSNGSGDGSGDGSGTAAKSDSKSESSTVTKSESSSASKTDSKAPAASAS